MFVARISSHSTGSIGAVCLVLQTYDFYGAGIILLSRYKHWVPRETWAFAKPTR